MFKLFKRKENKELQKLDKWLTENQRQRNEAMREIERISNILNNKENIKND